MEHNEAVCTPEKESPMNNGRFSEIENSLHDLQESLKGIAGRLDKKVTHLVGATPIETNKSPEAQGGKITGSFTGSCMASLNKCHSVLNVITGLVDAM